MCILFLIMGNYLYFRFKNEAQVDFPPRTSNEITNMMTNVCMSEILLVFFLQWM